ncbi:MAG: hypothetical protein H7A37_03835 [Chlamydiales bacterium]|nr:hypothetical protein [Chlamydiia bacterium]MCP5507417.1 hypothetical protein [Chlamydiales bacterium]
MKKRHLSNLALLGIASGLMVTQQAHADEQGAANGTEQQGCGAKNGCGGKTDEDIKDANNSNMGYHLMSEDELLLELNPQGEDLFENLNSEGKDLARYVASQRCNGTNLCKGLNACQTEHNACAGQGSCKGTGKCAFSDKNLAVKVVADHMKAKREQSMSH